MNISKTRQKIYQIEKKRGKILSALMHPKDMLLGSLYTLARKCGKDNCKCATGAKHESPYFSWSENGKTKLKYVRGTDFEQVRRWSRNYQKYQSRLATLRKLNEAQLELFKALRAAKERGYPS